MKRFPILIIALLGACSQGPDCGSSKKAFLREYFQLIDEAANLNLPVSDDQWKKYDERFRAAVEECYEMHEAELSAKERYKFWSGSMKYYAKRYGKGAIKELGMKKDRTAEKVKEEVEKIWDNTKEALKEATGEKTPDRVPKLEKLPTE